MILIAIIIFSSTTFLASEPEKFMRDYTASTTRILSCPIGEERMFLPPWKHSGYVPNKDLVDNVLVCLDSNNKLFTCYSGYSMVDHWTLNAGYRDDPIIKKKLNILTETDPYTKVEYKFNDVPEICNENPVNDIARCNNNYYVAHQNNVYVYQSDNPYIMARTLSQINHLNGKLAENDVIKKIFIDKNGNVIAISSRGTILKNSSPTLSSKKQIMSILSQSFPQDKTLYSMAYNEQNNIVLLGGHNFVHVVLLNDAAKTLSIPIEQLRINTIDIHNDYVLLSDIMQNPDTKKVGHCEGHFEYKNCCSEKTIPYTQWIECDKCRDTRQEWEQAKEEWENQTIKTSEAIEISFKQLHNLLQQKLPYSTPQPAECTHKMPPAEAASLIKSCRENTILLLSLAKLISALGQHKTPNISDLIIHKIHHKHPKRGERYNFKNELFTHASLIDNSLLLGYNDTNSSLWDKHHDHDYVFQVPFEKLSSDITEQICTNKQKNEKCKQFLLYDSDESDSPGYVNPDYNYFNPITIARTNDSKGFAIINTRNPCSKWCQGSCNDKAHRLSRIYNTILFTKDNTTNHSQPHYVIRSLHRTIRHFKDRLSHISVLIGHFIPMTTAVFFLYYLLIRT